jgi:tetratricopeptide (TPR) repeat protein
MNNYTGNITIKPAINEFENDMIADNYDSVLFESISEYMKGLADLEDAKKDPGLSNAQATAIEVISDYNKNTSKKKENGKFIREAFSATVSQENIYGELKFIRQESEDNKLNEITAEWVKEWHEKKQKTGIRDPKSEEIRNFITGAINTSESGPMKTLGDIDKKYVHRKLFARYASLSAAALIGTFILIKTLLPSPNPDKLFNTYYKPFNAVSPVTRNLDNNENFNYSSAIESYKTGFYQNAALGFADALQKNPSVISTQFFLGLSQLALNNYDQAINLLTGVANGSGEYRKEAKWYLGLAFLKTNNKQKAAECFEYLASSNGFYRERSEKILRYLK